ncbi:MAG TPA: HYR domain-containing protein [Streptosporangiaceae bacterium]|nr:HYR domain-containing protein [Streptosporangiaceae bacterium]
MAMRGAKRGLARMGRRGRKLGIGAAAVSLVAAGVIVAANTATAQPTTCNQSAATTITCTFVLAGGPQLFTVPPGVTSITAAAYGAQGGDGNLSTGGEGGEAQATFAVNPGDPVEVLVGGQGGSITSGSGGFNGGGAGGTLGTASLADGADGAGGGGASDVRLGSCASTLSCGLAQRVLVGGGGGGSVGGGGTYLGAGGGGGSPAGVSGDSQGGRTGGGGGGGSQTAGGTAGPAASCTASQARGGVAGGVSTQDAGGPGGAGDSSSSAGVIGGNGGGGGGGGYWGGAGGGGGTHQCGSSGAGGGGSSYGPAGATFANASGFKDGVVYISYTGTLGTPALSIPAASVPATSPIGTAIAANAIGATLAGSKNGATGTISFIVFGPQADAPTDCASGGTSVGTATVNGDGSYSPSAGYTPASRGTYWWFASYGGDAQDLSADSTCGAGMASTVVANHLTITAPADITVDATGTHGAVVSYPAPVVTDTGNPSPPAATCKPASGTVFPIGTTTVTCAATDPNAAPSSVSSSFTVTVAGAAALLAELHQAVQGLSATWSLTGTVATAQRQVSGRQPLMACPTLDSFIFEVKLIPPRYISPATSAALIADATRIEGVLGCRQPPAGPFLPSW